MPRLLASLVGNKYHLLTVISQAENSKANKRRWHCLCDCGNETVIVSSHLINGGIKSCGCLQKESIAKTGRSRLDDLTNKRFGRLVVISRAEDTKHGRPNWLCKCDCNLEKCVTSSNLRNKSTTSCGCYRLETIIKRFTIHGQSGAAKYLRAKAKRRHDRLKDDPVYIITLRLRDLIRKSIHLRGFRKESPTHKILGCNYDQLRQHIQSQFKDGMSWERFGEIHIDHITPMALAKTIDAAIRLNHYSNLQPLWAVDNLKKGARHTVNPKMLEELK